MPEPEEHTRARLQATRRTLAGLLKGRAGGTGVRPGAQIGTTISQAAEEMTRLGGQASERARALRPQLAETGQRAVADLTHGSKQVAERAGAAARRLGDERLAAPAQRVRESLPQMAEAVREDVEQAVATLGDAAGAVRADVGHKAAQLAESAGAVRADVSQKAANLAGATVRRSGGRSAKVKAESELVVASTSPALVTRPRQRRAGETARTLFWVSLVVAVVAYLCGNEERRQRTIATVRDTYNTAIDLYRDFQGYQD